MCVQQNYGSKEFICSSWILAVWVLPTLRSGSRAFSSRVPHRNNKALKYSGCRIFCSSFVRESSISNKATGQLTGHQFELQRVSLLFPELNINETIDWHLCCSPATSSLTSLVSCASCDLLLTSSILCHIATPSFHK